MSVEIRISDLHGKGMFATKDIKEGEVICHYGGYTMCFHCCRRNVKSDTGLLKRCEPYVLMDSNQRWVGDPQLVDEDNIDPFDCGFMINDAFRPKIFTSKNAVDYIDSVLEYYEKSANNSNCSLLSKCVARRDIKAGEEITTTYGYMYWANIDPSIEVPNKVSAAIYYAHQLTDGLPDLKTLRVMLNNMLDSEKFEEYSKQLKCELPEHEMKELKDFVKSLLPTKA